MPSTADILSSREPRTLPPLILHPFAGGDTTTQLLAGSKAMLTLKGLLPGEGGDTAGLEEIVLRGRIQEMRMLYFLGKDLMRWAEQCADFSSRQPELQKLGIRVQSFAALLVESPPNTVAAKLATWGVADFKGVFSRAFGLSACFGEPPTEASVAPVCAANYHRVADYLFLCFQNLVPYLPLTGDEFVFELYASSEYSAMLAQSWLTEE